MWRNPFTIKVQSEAFNRCFFQHTNVPLKMMANWCIHVIALVIWNECIIFFLTLCKNNTETNTMKMERLPIDPPPLLLLFNKLTVVWLFNSVWLCRLSSSWQQRFFLFVFVCVCVRSFYAKLFTWLKELFVSQRFCNAYTLSRHYLSAIHIFFLCFSRFFAACCMFGARSMCACT